MADVAGITVTLEAVTPLFLAGADPRGAPELRPPAFRGALRYWFRAAAGGALGGDIQAVARAEREVFGAAAGSAGGGDGERAPSGRRAAAGASAVVVGLALPAGTPASKVYAGNDFGTVTSGRRYLFWSMAESGSKEKGNYQGPKQYFPPGVRFVVELAPRRGAPAAGSRLEEAVAALWLLVQLGGVGSRARRLGGSLSARAPVQAAGLAFALQGASAAKVAEELGAGLRQVRAIFQRVCGHAATVVPGVPEFDVLHPNMCKVWVLDEYPTWENATDAVGGALRSYRIAAANPNKTAPSLLARTVFGLPLKGVAIHGAGIDRRASPLWLKLSKTQAGRYVAVATLFKSRFLPGDVQLNGSAPPRDYELIERWIAERFPQRAEVRYA